MSVTIRLTRTGRKNLPSYRVVATQTRTKRDGKFLDIIGFYNPSTTPASFDYDKKKYQDWISKGAMVSDAVKKIIEGKYEYTKYRPGKEETAEKETKEEKTVTEEVTPAAEETPEQA
ncbi:MAG: 30S ribosomal protein S16 [candidate division WWE3 bacterium GW2011_GWF2_41_45]|uniref:Small ribosomal subunit protein bS16 n=3 Tax=Katanobacteria TaxID=422282 RepID=A0A1F4W2N3_UNCKA|nr:MAG: 30S ribosomal protein S16 [candidate division WWE3 bacterium GW2011_GWC2_41_23]KKS10540.1 MAG: 30S ribosomal protein S16 [candidate division WWE3 bacterium GW2011_GWF2_41_45]KKS20265.1 MAG: 30S ribosomal protein S16 [candidate division WWE3 bacterium GW2011_GWE1_41_72]KKS28268.1 MAG: 30S ribosomal protein S16 [candidate division WWE3 bacterium GW2011_GWC1_42_102]KKS30267.1 MAG: 30S ribosomal protein S16 [candidate division WWE3 bacterium GW2011_GWD2_42_11]KKS51021.1 MAG: 30S ribosomal 